jgi:hypothetical protein
MSEVPAAASTTTDHPPPPPAPSDPPADPAPAPAPPPEILELGGELLERLRVAGAAKGLPPEKYILHLLGGGGAPRDPVPFYPTNADEMWRYAMMLANSTHLPKAYYEKDERGKAFGRARVADVHLTLMKGHDLGIKPMTAISNINIIDGKAEVGALLMVSLCLKSGMCEYFRPVRWNDRSATYITKRVGADQPVEFTYTIEMADRLGLLDKGKTEWARENNQWKKQPDTMLRRRAQSMLAREIYPDIVLGLYDHDELAELRERELALGIDPDRVIPMNGIEAPAAEDSSNGVPLLAALPAPSEKIELRSRQPAARETVPVRRPADPLKDRLKQRSAQTELTDASGAPVLGAGEVGCASCGVPVLGKLGDVCTACKNS